MTHERHTQQGLPEMKLHDDQQHLHRERVVKHTRRIAFVIAALLLGGLARTLYARWDESKQLEARVHENAVLHVRTVHPGHAGDDGKVSLPGTLQGQIEAQIYARAAGYVSHWYKNIGAQVKRGEVLATLDIPEVQRQVDEAAANYELAKTAFERWKRLRADDAVSQQELDEKQGAYKQAEAVLRRLREQLSYGQVLAPFDGIVTKRNVDVGDLVNAGNGGAAQVLFSMAQSDKLHVYFYVPQDLAPLVHVGDSVDIAPTDHPDQVVQARVSRTAGAIDMATRTLQVDVDLDNKSTHWLPGSYVEAAFKLNNSQGLALPTNTLLFNAKGVEVAAVVDGKVKRQLVVLGTDHGRTVDVRSGLTAATEVIMNPPDSIAEGQSVSVEKPEAAASSVRGE
ncbi:MAG: efflux RND transporter periplasmic adaptor subunit [Burkholderiaceae bacterium]|nr:efflux RND transporter periplasmic adaptor subunit [Roseateles sp.]MBV8469150.1 efflux RND transporter periplasmic adaptor subunit [Burkholderiaceae bacterium]